MTETAAELAPSSLQPVLTAIAGTIAIVLSLLGINEMLKRARERRTHTCARCGQSTEEKSAATACATCDGTGKVTEEHEAEAECPHCDGEGEESCPDCEGTGGTEEVPCETCEGTGKALDENGEPMKCGTCLGQGEASGSVDVETTCPDCGGTGKTSE
jgi:DnaJ-class molecular chaperone